ncbi:aldose epimerase [Brevundimonas sp. Leaf363]|uniref:aldose 1-epimerase n=1 Tax=Brevundimonas sp. Leaf363 TaxID=1736353 RepID=UPI0006F74B6D|nr:aldose 1-epimerase [Brevundimonas sp. Leaf363]KQS54282.1 aldose epimerase [Brevundimonas sp. Leaf363]
MIRLSHGDWAMTVLPDLGGAIGSLTLRGRDVLRPTPDGCDEILLTASFPLAPYANRIDHARFVFEDRKVELPATPGFEPHALHGDAWLAPWAVEAQDAVSVTLSQSHEAGAWPWAWTVRQTLALDEQGLSAEIALTNRSDAPMPGGVGFHPYFLRGPETCLTLAAEKVWLGADLIPDRQEAADVLVDWSRGQVVEAMPFVDNAYALWDGRAEVSDADRTVRLTASANARWVHVYRPQGEAFVCVEPVTHRPDALNAPPGENSGVQTLPPGETLTLAMRIGAE